MSAENLPERKEPERQRWEYVFLERSREIKRTRDGIIHTLEWNKDITSTIEALGEEGWELMAVGAGFTSDELWVFKRPK